MQIKFTNLRIPTFVANCLAMLILLRIAGEGEGFGGFVFVLLVLALLISNGALIYAEIGKSAEERDLERQVRTAELRKRLRELNNTEPSLNPSGKRYYEP